MQPIHVTLTVVDGFRFSDGRTVLVGTLDHEVPFIPRCSAVLFRSQQEVRPFDAEGEMLPSPGTFARIRGFRAISTRDDDVYELLGEVRDARELAVRLEISFDES